MRGVDAVVDDGNGVVVTFYADFVNNRRLVIDILHIRGRHPVAGWRIIAKAIGGDKIVMMRPESEFEIESHAAMVKAKAQPGVETRFRRKSEA